MPFCAFVNLVVINSEAGNFPFTSWHYRTKICIVIQVTSWLWTTFFYFLKPSLNYTNISTLENIFVKVLIPLWGVLKIVQDL